MDILKQEYDNYIQLKNIEVEEILLSKEVNRKMKVNDKKNATIVNETLEDKNIEEQDINNNIEEKNNKDIIDYRTKKTISNIKLEQDRKLKASKNYKKKQSELFLSGQLI